MGTDEELEDIHRDVRESRDAILRKLEEQTALARENVATQQSILVTLITMRDNIWHKHKQILDRFAQLLGWKHKGDG